MHGVNEFSYTRRRILLVTTATEQHRLSKPALACTAVYSFTRATLHTQARDAPALARARAAHAAQTYEALYPR